MVDLSQKPYNCSCVYDCDRFTQADIELLYQEYSALDKAEQSTILSRYIIEKNSKKKARPGRRTNFYFYLPTGESSVLPVCQKMFCYAFRLSKTELHHLTATSTETANGQGCPDGNTSAAATNEVADADKAAQNRAKLSESIDIILSLLLSDAGAQRAEYDYSKVAVTTQADTATATTPAADSNVATADLQAANAQNTLRDNEKATILSKAIAEEIIGIPSNLLPDQDIVELKLTATAAALASAVAAAIGAILAEKQSKLAAATGPVDSEIAIAALAVAAAEEEQFNPSDYVFESEEKLELATSVIELRAALTDLTAAIGAEITLAAIEITTEAEKFTEAIAAEHEKCKEAMAKEEFDNRVDLKGREEATANGTAVPEQADEQPTTAPEEVAETLVCLALKECTRKEEAAAAEGSNTIEEYSEKDSAIANDPTATAIEEVESNIICYIPPAAVDEEGDLSLPEAQLAQTEDDSLGNATTAVQELRILHKMFMYRKFLTM